jgi:hypothetical protein
MSSLAVLLFLYITLTALSAFSQHLHFGELLRRNEDTEWWVAFPPVFISHISNRPIGLLCVPPKRKSSLSKNRPFFLLCHLHFSFE